MKKVTHLRYKKKRRRCIVSSLWCDKYCWPINRSEPSRGHVKDETLNRIGKKWVIKQRLRQPRRYAIPSLLAGGFQWGFNSCIRFIPERLKLTLKSCKPVWLAWVDRCSVVQTKIANRLPSISNWTIYWCHRPNWTWRWMWMSVVFAICRSKND